MFWEINCQYVLNRREDKFCTQSRKIKKKKKLTTKNILKETFVWFGDYVISVFLILCLKMFKIQLFVFLTIIFLVKSQERDHTRTRNLQTQRRNGRSFRVKLRKSQKNFKKINFYPDFSKKMIQTFSTKF